MTIWQSRAATSRRTEADKSARRHFDWWLCTVADNARKSIYQYNNSQRFSFFPYYYYIYKSVFKDCRRTYYIHTLCVVGRFAYGFRSYKYSFKTTAYYRWSICTILYSKLYRSAREALLLLLWLPLRN